MRSAMTASEESGVIMTPEAHKARRKSEKRARASWGRRLKRAVPYVIVMMLISGAAFGAHRVITAPAEPVHDPLPQANAALAEAHKEAIDAEGRARAAETELAEAKAKLAAAADTKKDLETKAAAARTELQDKLSGAAGRNGAVTQDGESVRLELVDKVLFAVGEAELTERGADVLDRVGVALNEVPDKQIWVQGHTDDSPIRPAKGVTPMFESNWELSAARALTVVHYLQDVSGVDPRRLAAVAFGENRPASRTKAKNRRIEIVLYPKHQVARD